EQLGAGRVAGNDLLLLLEFLDVQDVVDAALVGPRRPVALAAVLLEDLAGLPGQFRVRVTGPGGRVEGGADQRRQEQNGQTAVHRLIPLPVTVDQAPGHGEPETPSPANPVDTPPGGPFLTRGRVVSGPCQGTGE